MTDPNARYQTYNQAEQQLVNDVAWLPMEQVAVTYLLKPYVIGVVDNAQDLTPPDDWASIYIAQH
jgi:peptide/nickel transport system substrate-binding protein/oligopeptide transport system substrate-binding protein